MFFYNFIRRFEQMRRRGPGVRNPQRRPVALVVIVQIKRLCQRGGGPASTQNPMNFWTPMDKNSQRS